MLYVSLILESLRAQPRLMFWTAALSQAALWTLLPTLFYSAPPGGLPIVLAVGHEFQLGSDGGPPLAFWLAEVAYRLGGIAGVYLLSQLCVLGTLMGIFALGRATVGTPQAVLAVLLMVGIAAMSVPTPEFGPAILAMPIWTMVLLHFWRAVGEGRSEYWIALAVGMGLLILTTSLGLLFFILLAIFAAGSARGRAAFRSIDPWLCTFVAILVAAPYLAWLVHAEDVWRPALVRLHDIDLRATAGQWARILWNLSVAHVGVVIFAFLASPWQLPRGTRVPTVNRLPMQPLARSMIYFFALAPLLAATLVIVLFGLPSSLAHVGPLARLLRPCGDGDGRQCDPALPAAHAEHGVGGFLAGPRPPMVIALLVLPWTGVDFKVLYPADDIRRSSETFERRTGRPLAIVAGDPDIAALVALEPAQPSELVDGCGRRVRAWVTSSMDAEKGAVIVWPCDRHAGYAAGPQSRARFPHPGRGSAARLFALDPGPLALATHWLAATARRRRPPQRLSDRSRFSATLARNSQ